MEEYQEYLVRVYSDRTHWLHPITRKLHRLDGPAVVYNNGNYYWYFNNERHRDDDEPAAQVNGTKFYYKNNVLHRDNGPAIIYENGIQDYFVKGVLHRENGPAIVFPEGGGDYYLNGETHREDGPALDRKDYKAWFLNGKRYNTKFDFDKEIKRRYYQNKIVEVDGQKFKLSLIEAV